ncbi:sialidase-like [Carcharodon carcharias]|uniref:sialidase-like n=1 Tax=Carcharodon carcharias TaxID=13397 RepID=UPI001B7EAF06|nr:sialidase-like [Carcharodon carcharias]
MISSPMDTPQNPSLSSSSNRTLSVSECPAVSLCSQIPVWSLPQISTIPQLQNLPITNIDVNERSSSHSSTVCVLPVAAVPEQSNNEALPDFQTLFASCVANSKAQETLHSVTKISPVNPSSGSCVSPTAGNVFSLTMETQRRPSEPIKDQVLTSPKALQSQALHEKEPVLLTACSGAMEPAVSVGMVRLPQLPAGQSQSSPPAYSCQLQISGLKHMMTTSLETAQPSVLFLPAGLSSVVLHWPLVVPTVPTLPSVPTVPTVPTLPSDSTGITIPSVPTVSTLPNDSTVLTVPSVSTDHAAPSIPTVSTVLTVPNGHAAPSVATVPSDTGVPTVPSDPTVPAVPCDPAVPNVLSDRTVPTVPSDSTVPTVPTVPSDSTVLTVPTAFTVPSVPTVPSVSSDPASCPAAPAVPTVKISLQEPCVSLIACAVDEGPDCMFREMLAAENTWSANCTNLSLMKLGNTSLDSTEPPVKFSVAERKHSESLEIDKQNLLQQMGLLPASCSQPSPLTPPRSGSSISEGRACFWHSRSHCIDGKGGEGIFRAQDLPNSALPNRQRRVKSLEVARSQQQVENDESSSDEDRLIIETE